MADTSSTPRTSTMRFQGPMNRIVRAMLATPLLSRGIGRRLITLHVVGRKSGKRYTVPVAYTRHEGDLLIGAPFAWARNLRTGEPVEVRYLGRIRQADVRVYTDEADVLKYYDVICRDNHNFASINKVGIDAAGNPDPKDIGLARAAGARVLRLTVT